MFFSKAAQRSSPLWIVLTCTQNASVRKWASLLSFSKTAFQRGLYSPTLFSHSIILKIIIKNWSQVKTFEFPTYHSAITWKFANRIFAESLNCIVCPFVSFYFLFFVIACVFVLIISTYSWTIIYGCVEGHGLMRTIGDGWMVGQGGPVGLFQPEGFYGSVIPWYMEIIDSATHVMLQQHYLRTIYSLCHKA